MKSTLFDRHIPFRLLRSVCRSADVQIWGHCITVPLERDAALAWLYWKPTWKTELLGLFLRQRSGTFVDIGANVGQTLADFIAAGVTTPYFGFEPNSRCVAFLSDVVSMNKWPNVDIIPIGLSSLSGLQPLYSLHGISTDQTASIHADLRPSSQSNRAMEWVPVARLDDLTDSLRLSSISLIKIDIEGAELDALEGMQQILAEVAPPILCEVLLPDISADLQVYEMRTQRLSDLLRQYRYSIHRLIVTTEGRFAGLEPVEEFPLSKWSPSLAHRCDYLFSPHGLDLSFLTTVPGLLS